MADLVGRVPAGHQGPLSPAQAALSSRRQLGGQRGAHLAPAPGIMASNPRALSVRSEAAANIGSGIDSVFKHIDAAHGQITKSVLSLAARVLDALAAQTGTEADFARAILEPLLDLTHLETFGSDAFVDSQLGSASSSQTALSDSGDDALAADGTLAVRESLDEFKITEAKASVVATLTELKDYGQLAIHYGDSGVDSRRGRLTADRKARVEQLDKSFPESVRLLSGLGEVGAQLKESLQRAYSFARRFFACK